MKKYSFLGSLLLLSLNAAAMNDDAFHEVIKPSPVNLTICSHETLYGGLFNHFLSHLTTQDLYHALKDKPFDHPVYGKIKNFPNTLLSKIISTMSPIQITDLWKHIVDAHTLLLGEKDRLNSLKKMLLTPTPMEQKLVICITRKEEALVSIEENLKALDQSILGEKLLIKTIRELYTYPTPIDVQSLLKAGLTIEEIMEGPFVHIKIGATPHSIILKFIQLLADNTTILSFDFDSKAITLTSQEIMAIGNTLKKNKTLLRLGLDIKRITTISKDNYISSYFNDPATQISEPLVNALKINRTLGRIDLNNAIISNAVMNNLSDGLLLNRRLTALDLSKTHISCQSLVYLLTTLISNRTLLFLNIAHRSKRVRGTGSFDQELTKAMGSLLKTHPVLCELNMSWWKLDTGDIPNIAEGILASSSLKILSMVGNSINDGGLKIITDALSQNPKLKKLCIGFNNFTHASVDHLTHFLKKNTVLSTLDMGLPKGCVSSSHLNKNGENGVNTFFKALQNNPTLTALDLGYVGGEKCIPALVEVLKHNPLLTKVNLENCTFQKNEADALGTILENNTTLKTFNLKNIIYCDGVPPIAKEIIEPLARSLWYNTSLTELGFGSSYIGEDGAKYLSVMLSKNKTLKVIDLSGFYGLENNITPAGLKFLCQGLQLNTSLKSLDLSNNILDCTSLPILSNLIKTNSTLSFLNIRRNSLAGYEEHMEDFMAALSSNKTLVQIDASECNFEEDTINELEEEFPSRFILDR